MFKKYEFKNKLRFVKHNAPGPNRPGKDNLKNVKLKL